MVRETGEEANNRGFSPGILLFFSVVDEQLIINSLNVIFFFLEFYMSLGISVMCCEVVLTSAPGLAKTGAG